VRATGAEERVSVIEIPNVAIIHETLLAILVLVEGRSVWIPKSCLDGDSDIWAKEDDAKFNRGTLRVDERFARGAGLHRYARSA
jgi:hypothetical protein